MGLFALHILIVSAVILPSLSLPVRRPALFKNSLQPSRFQPHLPLMEKATPFDLDPSTAKHVNAWCGLHGLMYTDGQLSWTPAPISLLPSTFNRDAYNFAVRIQPIWNTLMDKISRDRAFLLNELAVVGGADEFTLRVMKLYEHTPEDVIANGLQFGIFRSDYMLNHDNRLLQVEINTIAASFGCLSSKVMQLHRHLLRRFEDDPQFAQLRSAVADKDLAVYRDGLQDNPSLASLASALATAHHAAKKGPTAVILFVVQPNERNQVDQHALEAALWESHGIAVHFITLAQASQLCSVSQSELFFHAHPSSSSPAPVSVVYYRAGYSPQDYPSEVEWQAREMLEQSSAIKCPNAGYHLAGTKAIQAALCKPGVLEKFLSPDDCDVLRQSFAKQYALGDPDVIQSGGGHEALEEAQGDGSAWVLKPQREGGGNNLYGQALSAFVRDHRHHPDLQGYVLMQRIFPKLSTTAFYRRGQVELASSISELGIYGAFLGHGQDSKPLLNSYCGYLLRTKGAAVDEGGVAAGYSVLNSLSLQDD